ncbi:MAG: Gfo/Idh/MocA family oxidoreductase [Acidobacteria bacterium]|nr:Gfo/Idh/MocA family oxidoreductase [Acidobacteriota bacterium]
MRIAIIGLGFMGSTHLKGLQSVKGASLVAVAESDPVKRSGDMSGIQGNLGGPGEKYDFTNVAQYAGAAEAFADPNVDAVDICLPTNLHKPLTLAALKADKHVLVEKPMGLSRAECEEMIAAADSAGKILMAAQVLRFFPAYTALKRLLDSGQVGAVRSALFRRRCAAPAWGQWLKQTDKSGGGVFDLLIHDVDMANHLFGKPRAVSATGYENLEAGIDSISAQLHYDSIPSVTITGGWHHPKAYPFSMEYTVSADGGTIDFSTDNRPPTLYNAAGESSALALDDVDGYAAEIQYFADCVNAGKQPELCMPRDSALSVHIALCMNESRANGGKPVSC